MNTQNLNPSPAAVDSVVLWTLHTQALFDRATARRLQAVAGGIARQLYRGYFGNTAGFEGIESETCHG
ncbi:MAG: hypothetical protein IH627_15680 [Rubrivivax sp.]|nr:hypothetical protein [Rubrivivax sp.]